MRDSDLDGKIILQCKERGWFHMKGPGPVIGSFEQGNEP